ncbi:MAG: hypothetical protein K1060chlam4_00571 [Candidatus Anoxychlamydiales bacterium]|nr:hypothetical protein [Candidatus Anoxychlamydiales bacterium]
MSISKTLTFSKAAKFPVPERVQENVKAMNFSKSIGNNNLGASLSLLSKKDKGLIAGAATIPNPKYVAKATLNKIRKINPFRNKQAASQIKDSTYIDMGIFEGLIGKAITWYSKEYPKGFYDTKNLNAQLDTVFNPLVADGTDQINLSFAQISNIKAILNPDLTKSYSGSDKILEILRFNPSGDNLAMNKPIVQDGKELPQDIIQYISSYANSKGIKVDLSFGGAVAQNSDYVLGDPVEASNNLVALMDKYDMQTVDFDIEDPEGLMANGTANVVSFFKTLHTALAAKDKKVLLTVLGATSNGPKGPLKPIFDEFDSCADGVRLMLYNGGSQFYIDANNPSWGLKAWEEIIDDPSKIAIGFYDKVPYETPQSSDAAYSAEKYSGFPTNPTRAEAAAWIYKKVSKDSGLSIDKLGEPFIWTDDPLTISTNTFFQEFDKALNQ